MLLVLRLVPPVVLRQRVGRGGRGRGGGHGRGDRGGHGLVQPVEAGPRRRVHAVLLLLLVLLVLVQPRGRGELRAVVAAVGQPVPVVPSRPGRPHGGVGEGLAVERGGEEVDDGAALLLGLGRQLAVASLDAVLLHRQGTVHLRKAKNDIDLL